jgi:hypothetical protein
MSFSYPLTVGFRETLWPLFRYQFGTLAFSLHPSVKQILFEPPAIPQFESGNALLAEILV